MGVRKSAAKALAAGLFCWGMDLFLAFNLGIYGPTLIVLGGLGVFAGILGLVWGESFRTMAVAQKVPAALIALVVTSGGCAAGRWLS